MNFGAFTPISREVIITFVDGTKKTVSSTQTFDWIKKHLCAGKKVKTIKNR